MARLFSDDAIAGATIWQEARGELQEGRIGVAEVIRERMARRYSSDGTVAGTVLRPFQFSGWNTSDPSRARSLMLDDADPIVGNCIEAWRWANAHKSTLTHGALLYYNPDVVTPIWAASAHEVAVIGHHRFMVPNELYQVRRWASASVGIE